MKKHKLRNLDDNEMRNQLREMDDQLFRLKFQLRMGQTDGLKKIRTIKKDRARIMTWLREKELAGAAK
ncbi:MAG TPA: 50S ribosomal protein L29 [Bryobacteraceae bacterium]|jgi:large subunit ribosomal protein L29